MPFCKQGKRPLRDSAFDCGWRAGKLSGQGTFVKTKPISDIEQKLKTLYNNTSVEQLVEFRIIIEERAAGWQHSV